MREERLSWILRTKVALDIAKGMRHLGGVYPPIIHRDLRSPNVFINKLSLNVDVCAKVGDFGLAQYTLPTLEQMLETWAWLPPEVIDSSNRKYNTKVDVYSYGVVLYEITARTFPFSEFKEHIKIVEAPLDTEQRADASLIRKLKAEGWKIKGNKAVQEQYNTQTLKALIIEEDLRPTVPENTPKWFADLIRRCWAGDPDSRPTFDYIVETIQIQFDQYVAWCCSLVMMDGHGRNLVMLIFHPPPNFPSPPLLSLVFWCASIHYTE